MVVERNDLKVSWGQSGSVESLCRANALAGISFFLGGGGVDNEIGKARGERDRKG